VELERITTQPELVVTPRAGLATAYLAFGSGPAFAGTRVRRAIASALDRTALTDGSFPAGSVVPTHLTPCVIEGGCAGRPWYEFNAPAAAAALADATFNLASTYVLHVPDAPVPGLADPGGVAEAVRAQLADNLGLTVTIDPMPLDAFREAVDRGTLSGLYLDGIVTSLVDPTGILVPLFGAGVRTTPARRLRGVSDMLDEAASTADATERTDAITRANDAIRSGAVVVPLAHPGTVMASRSDVTGVVTSPLGLDPLGAMTPGDRPQVVFMQATAPDGAYCGDQQTADALRLCALVTQGLYGFDPGGLVPVPRLAQRCTPNRDATVWTCRLRSGITFADGKRLDAGDVVASFAAQWDRSGPLRAAEPGAPFAAWDELFGGTIGG
jgi:peptide/nickel transport system substrate-binding protein